LISQASHARSHNITTDNSSYERAEQFQYLGTNITNQNSIQEEIKSRLKSGNACCHSVQNVWCSSLLSKNIRIKIYGIIILPVILYGCETWSLTFGVEERKLMVCDNTVPRENITCNCDKDQPHTPTPHHLIQTSCDVVCPVLPLTVYAQKQVLPTFRYYSWMF